MSQMHGLQRPKEEMEMNKHNCSSILAVCGGGDKKMKTNVFLT